MEKSGTEQILSHTKKAATKKTSCIISQIQGVRSQKYSVEFVKKGC